VLGKAVLHGGTAMLKVARSLVLNKAVTIVYKGDADFLASTETMKILSSSVGA
jgi:hypothetical protein